MSVNLGERREYNPFILALAGSPLSGKTTLALELSCRTNLVRLDIDEAGLALDGVLGNPPRNWFERSMLMMVKYSHMHRIAGNNLVDGNPVLVAATYSHETYHDALRLVLADTYRRYSGLREPPLRIFELDAPAENLLKRATERARLGNTSDVTTLEHAMDLRQKFVHWPDADDVVRINTGLPIEQNTAQILESIEPFRRAA